MIDIIGANNRSCLKIDREGGAAIKIVNLDATYLDKSVSISRKGSLNLKSANSKGTSVTYQAESGQYLLVMGAIPRIANKYNKLYILTRSTPVFNMNKTICGWKLVSEEISNKKYDEEVFNTKFELVGYVKNGDVTNIHFEFIGRFVDGYILYPHDCYESGEPIYISVENRNFKRFSKVGGFDLSFRLFDRTQQELSISN